MPKPGNISAEELGKFGLASGTDTHTGLTTAEEDNFFGKHPGVQPGPTRWEHVTLELQGRKVMCWEMAASGYTAVWATDSGTRPWPIRPRFKGRAAKADG